MKLHIPFLVNLNLPIFWVSVCSHLLFYSKGYNLLLSFILKFRSSQILSVDRSLSSHSSHPICHGTLSALPSEHLQKLLTPPPQPPWSKPPSPPTEIIATASQLVPVLLPCQPGAQETGPPNMHTPRHASNAPMTSRLTQSQGQHPYDARPAPPLPRSDMITSCSLGSSHTGLFAVPQT